VIITDTTRINARQAPKAHSFMLNLLNLIPARYAFLLVILTSLTGCIFFRIGSEDRSDAGGDADRVVDAEFDAGVDGEADVDLDSAEVEVDTDPDYEVDADQDSDSGCRVGDRRPSYDGPDGTEGIGVCRPRIEECIDGHTFVVTQEEVLPSEEVCDGVDNDCVGETPIEEWSRTFGGENNVEFSAIQPTSDGGFIAAGSPHSWGVEFNEGWLVKIDGAGRELWSRTFSRSWEAGFFSSIQPTSDGGFIAVGLTVFLEAEWGGDLADGWLVKTNEAGIEQWDRTFGGEGYDFFSSIQPTVDGGYILTGETFSFGAGGYDGWLIKTNGSGIEQWQRTFGGEGYDSFSSIQPTSDGGFILAGYTESFGSGLRDGWLVRTDGAGIEQWRRTFGGEGTDHFYSVQQTSDGGFVAAGLTQSFGSGRNDGWLVRTDGAGIELWSRTFSGGGSDSFSAIQPTSDGGFIVAGDTYSIETERSVGWLVKVCVE